MIFENTVVGHITHIPTVIFLKKHFLTAGTVSGQLPTFYVSDAHNILGDHSPKASQS